MKKIYISMFFAFVIFTIFHDNAKAQTCSPNCNDLNASISLGGTAVAPTFEALINWTDIISNFACAAPIQVRITTKSGTVLFSGSSDDPGNMASVVISNPCRYSEEGVKIYVDNGLGACWSNVTFKASAPIIEGRRVAVYCDHPIVADPTVLINDEYPATYVACVGFGTPSYTTDWIFVKDCDPGVQDTVKQILREWEYVDKTGKRASAFDTIDVMLFPEITADHIYCAEKDTVYCGEPKYGVGPYITVDSLLTGVCDTTYLIEVEDKDKDGMLEFVARDFDDKCGLNVHVDYEKFGGGCEVIYKVSIDIKQDCYGAAQTTCVVTPPAGTAPNMAEQIAPGYWRCVVWITDLDTLPPIAECKLDGLNADQIYWSQIADGIGPNLARTHCFDTTQGAPIVVVPTGTHECAAHTYIPPLCIYDDWSGVKQVKASIEGFGSWVLTKGVDSCELYVGLDTVWGECYESHTLVKLPKSEVPYVVLYEAYDNCHNIDSSYCFLYVKDATKPVPVVDKGVTVSLGDKKAWVNAETFDEGSWDNCGINLLLVRRKDWKEACVDLCDSIVVCCTTEHHDTLRTVILEEDKHIDEVEAHYAKTLKWLREDEVPCGNLIYNAWQYALMKYATLECVEHPYAVDEEYFRSRFLECYEDYLYDGINGSVHHDIDPGPEEEFCFDRWGFVDPYFNPGCEPHVASGSAGLLGLNSDLLNPGLLQSEEALISVYEAIGGGWAEDVPFSCEDACSSVTVEILTMDYWCNWAVAWTDVWVEDLTPAQVVNEVQDGSLTCKTYKDKRYNLADEDHPVSLEYIVELAKQGEDAAFLKLDSVFGGYQKAWVDSYGNYVDIDGNEIETEIPFYDSMCQCTSKVEKYRIYDDHLGYIWVDSLITDCYYEQDTSSFEQGIVKVNCAQNVFCEQEVWCDFDHCGEGYIYRKFKIWQSCPDTFYNSSSVPDSLKHPVDTTFRTQRIYVGNNCDLNKFMFDVPKDLDVYSCGIQYDPDGSGNVVGDAGPESTGYATYKFDDDCRLVGIAHEDKVFKIVGGEEACYKIIRTWYFADWCGTGGAPVSGKWWGDYSLVLDSCVQKILVYDTTAPVCYIEGPSEDGGSLEVGSCTYDLSVAVNADDSCGLTGYYWELKDISSETDHFLVDSGNEDLEGIAGSFDITSDDLLPGIYKLKIEVSDECNNESYCEYTFTILSVKKPTPVCVTSITADLTPWDSDSDGIADSAHAVVWAEEFDRSSQAPCGVSEDSLSFYIEFIDADLDQDAFDIDRVADSLVVTCEHVGTKMVRLWVVDNFGTADYCDVLLVTQNNAEGCGPVISNGGSVIGNIENENGSTVEEVQVMAESNEALNSISSGSDGSYRFEAPMGAIVTLTPQKNTDPINGVTTADLVKMLDVISEKEELPSAYRRLAADVNRDGFINTLDLLDLRQLIVGTIDKLPKTDSWRFITKDYVFESATPEGENVPERLVFNLDQPTMKGDFIGMKMGDLDMDSDPRLAAPRSGNNLVFTTQDMMLQAGNTYQIPLAATTFDKVAGYQYTLEIDRKVAKIVDIDIEGGIQYMDETNYGFSYLSDGLLTTSWNTTSKGADLEWGQKIFTVALEIKEDVMLSDIMTISSRMTNAESYQKGKTGSVALQFDVLTDLGTEVALFQNVPNPARDFTDIEFYLPSKENIQLVITDLSGKRIKTITGEFSAGKHRVSLKSEELPSAQVYFYSLVAGETVITKKMVFVR